MNPLRIATWTALATAAGLLVVWPIIELVRVVVEDPGGSIDAQSAVNSLIVGAGTAIVATAVGVAAAIATQRFGVRERRLLQVGIVLPILIPPFVSAIGFLRGYGPGGYLDDLVGFEIPGLFGIFGIILVTSINAVPLAYLITLAALGSRRTAELEMASRISGAGPLTTWTRISVPLVSAAILASSALVFVVGINAFGVPAVLGTPAGFDTMTTSIYQDLALSARPESFSRAILTAVVLVVIALGFVIAGETLLNRTRVVFGQQSSVTPSNRRLPVWLKGTIAGFVLAFTVGPLLALLATALTRGVGLAPVPANLTLNHFEEALSSGLLTALGRSAGLAAAAASAAVLLGVAATSLRKRSGHLWASRISTMGFAIPGSTLAVAVLLAYGPPLRDTLLLIAIAYVAKLWAIGHRAIEGSHRGLNPDLTRAARVSGASESTTLRTIVVPMLRPALVAGWLLVFVFAFHEVTMSSLLYGPGSETLAVEVLNVQQLGDLPLSAALALTLTIPVLLLALPLGGRRALGR